MRIAFFAFLLPALSLLAGGAWAQAIPNETNLPPKTFSSAADVQALIAKAKAEHKTDATTSEIIAALAPYHVNLEYRTAPTPPSLHVKEAELMYVIEGGGTLTMGGKLVNAKVTRPDNLGGTAITGGKDEALTPGSFVFVPENTPHGFSAVKGGHLVTMSFHVPRPLPK